jgi:hypothetical protein
MPSAEDLKSVERLLENLPPDKLQKLVKLPGMAGKLEGKWVPNPGPQTRAFHCEADELFYGGAAGGGKTELLLGLAVMSHKDSLILRRTNKEASRFIKRFSEIIGHKDGWNAQQSTFTLPDKHIEFGGCQLEEDKQKFKGDPHDLVAFDEIADFTETQYRFLIGWNRSAVKGQRCRVVVAGNPPTTPEGYWVERYWGAWLDEHHPNPAKEGELRWYTTIGGHDEEVDGPGPHMIDDMEVMAKSRTFIQAFFTDNPDLSDAGYGARLAAMPEEGGLRDAYFKGKFGIAVSDDEKQVIPTEWIRQAQERWLSEGYKGLSMTAIGIDPSGGGKDETVAAARYGTWYAPMITAKGEETVDGSAMAGMILHHRRDGCPIVIDVGGGYAGGMIVRFNDNGIAYHKFDATKSSMATAQGSGLKFANKRSEVWWKFREALDPDQEGGCPIALPPDSELRADLASVRLGELGPRGIILESKDKIRARIGRSPDKGDAVVICWSEGNKAAERRLSSLGRAPKVILGYSKLKRGR